MLALLSSPGRPAAAARAAAAARLSLVPRRPLSADAAARALAAMCRHGHHCLVSTLMQQSHALMKLSLVQCGFVLIQRTRRSLQLFELYSSLYESEALKEMVRAVRRLLAAHGRRLLASAAILSSANPPAAPEGTAQKNQPRKQPAAKSETHGYEEEFERFAKLREQSIICPECRRRQLIDKQVAGVQYCSCANGQPTSAVNRGHTADVVGWTPLLERNNVVVWRRAEPDAPNLYSYRVYGSYDDVSADSFLEVQLNTEYRTKWDSSALELRTLHQWPAQRTDLIYWQVRFPRMFNNRDYVFERRYYVDDAARQMTIVSECTQHAECPPRPGVVRVHHYWSVMVIRPHTEFHQPGLDFALTYFDDPGTYLPPFITNYVAYSGLPDFLSRVAEAARTVQRQIRSGNVSVPLCFLEHPRKEVAIAPTCEPLDELRMETESVGVSLLKQVEELQPSVEPAKTNDESTGLGNAATATTVETSPVHQDAVQTSESSPSKTRTPLQSAAAVESPPSAKTEPSVSQNASVKPPNPPAASPEVSSAPSAAALQSAGTSQVRSAGGVYDWNYVSQSEYT